MPARQQTNTNFKRFATATTCPGESESAPERLNDHVREPL